MEKETPFFARQVTNNRERLGKAWEADFNRFLESFFSSEDAMRDAVRGYGRFSLVSMRRMKRFETTRKYEIGSYSKVATQVYHDPHYMQSEYLPALVLSQFLWPHHYQVIDFFRTHFLAKLPPSDKKKFYDVGIGTGFFSALFLREVSGISGVGVDISDSSILFTQQYLKKYGFQDRYDFVKQNILEIPLQEECADHLISIEVLEHLEQPLEFLKQLRKMLRPGGRAFITAALNAPELDHIYLYTTPDQVRDQVIEAGFKPEESHYAAAYSPKGDAPVPAVASFILT
jgi:2-polyprenyl-3-methyl-5-hydroxy-6-metoxy-1,4-benzoquinol methylase